MTWCAFLHGFIFAVVLQDGHDGFGMLASFRLGDWINYWDPVGLILS